MRKLLKWMGEWVFALFGGGGVGVRPVRRCAGCEGCGIILVHYHTVSEWGVIKDTPEADALTVRRFPYPRPVPCPYCGGKGTVRLAG